MKMILTAVTLSLAAVAPAASFTFDNIDGGEIDLTAWRGQPVLVVNTASLCGFTDQYSDLQQIYETYRDAGLVVLAVPSDDFAQELGTEAEVKEFCEINYALDLPMTEITQVTGADAHPFYAWVRAQTGFEPSWNFNKILLSPEGEVTATWGAGTNPTGRTITAAVEALING